MTLTNIVKKKTDSIKELCRPMVAGANQCWKLGVQESEDSEIEEVVLRIQGIVSNRELPPIRRPFKVYVLTFQLNDVPDTHTATDNPTGDSTYGNP
jgi:hypothetical protein